MKINLELLSKDPSYSLRKVKVGRLPSGNTLHVNVHEFDSRKDGPCILFLAGLHGDESNGIHILINALSAGIFSNPKRGKIVVIPLLNVFGFINFSRDVPDGKDVNRSFPGTKTGSLASRIAYSLTKEILPQIDYGVDFHTGGGARYNYPQLRISKYDARALAYAERFGAPFIIEKPLISKSLRKEAAKRNIPMLVFEGGESLRHDDMSINLGLKGIVNLLVAEDMINGQVQEIEKLSFVNRTRWLRATSAGIVLNHRYSGEHVKKGDVLATIQDINTLKKIQIKSPADSWIIGHNNSSVVHSGDALFHIGEHIRI